MTPPQEFVVDPAQAGERADVFVAKALGISRAEVRRLWEEDAVRVDGKRIKPGERVRPEARVRVTWEELSRDVVPEDLPLVVLHEDPELVIVDKPAHAPSHPLRAEERGTVANALVARYPECALASEDPREGGLCHRLDRETSGALLAARSREAWQAMREAFSQRSVEKRYWALVTGPLADEGEIDLPLRHAAKQDHVEPAAAGGPDAREATSRFRVLARAGEYSLVEVQILTGVLHQVRAHLGAIGAPIVGDLRYGGREAAGLDRFFLHARLLGFTHPTSGLSLRIESPLPDDLRRALEARGIDLAPQSDARL